MNTTTSAADVAIIGGGPAGLALALDPALADRRIAVIEAGSWDGFRAGETMAPTSDALLGALGVADVLATTATTCEGTSVAWASDELEYEDHWQTVYGPAYFLARPAFDAELAARVAARGHAVMSDTKVTGIGGRPGAWSVEVRGSGGTRRLQAGMLVDASGRRAVVARRLGEPPRRLDRLVAHMVRVPAQAATPPRVVVEARPDGWWYASPVPGGDVVLAYLTDSDLSTARGALEQALAETTYVKALANPPNGARFVVRPAWSALLQSAAGRGWIAVGDAATSFDPLTSTGIHNALRTSAAAAGVLEAAVRGDPSGVDEYVRARRADFGTFLTERARVYDRQARFDTTFWRRRRGLQPLLEAGASLATH